MYRHAKLNWKKKYEACEPSTLVKTLNQKPLHIIMHHACNRTKIAGKITMKRKTMNLWNSDDGIKTRNNEKTIFCFVLLSFFLHKKSKCKCSENEKATGEFSRFHPYASGNKQNDTVDADNEMNRMYGQNASIVVLQFALVCSIVDIWCTHQFLTGEFIVNRSLVVSFLNSK